MTDKDDMPDKEDAEAIAAIVGMTSSSLSNIDEQIISSSTNLQKSADAWNPTAVLKQGMTSTGVLSETPGQPPPQQMDIPPAGVAPAVQQPIMQQPIMQQPAPQVYAQPQAFITDPQILERLDKIEQVLSSLSVTEDKIMKSLLKNNTKQITIRFDDSKPSK